VVTSARASSSIAALVGGAFIAMAVPLVDLLFRRGHFTVDKVAPTAIYLSLFSGAIALWGMQGILARAFYATGNTLTPMLAGTVITLLTLPIYWLMSRAFGPNGLVIASDLGILLHTASLLVLLPRRLPFDRASLIGGVARSVILSAFATMAARAVVQLMPLGRLHGHGASLVQILVGGGTFTCVVMFLMKPLGVVDVTQLIEKTAARFRQRRSGAL
jgi:putative peptidoglycan lipid II flippase